jgi:hypothetical protein
MTDDRRAGRDGTGTAVGPSARQLGGRLRVPAVLAGLVLVAAILVGLVQSGQVHGELDPNATDPAGSRALRVLLEQQHVTVLPISSTGEALAPATTGGTEPGDAATVLFVAYPNELPTAALRAMGETPFRVVLVAPDAVALRQVTSGIAPAGSTPVRPRNPGCAAQPGVLAGLSDLGGRTYREADGAADVCYDGALVLGRTLGGGPLVVVGTPAPFTNERLADNGNAALALAALGAGAEPLPATEVRWLRTVPLTTGAGRAGLLDVLPPWVPRAQVQLLFAGVLVALWRGRRLGPVVTEPLPVVVRAAETVQGRSRLYRRVRATDRAADALRNGTLARLVPRVGIGVAPSRDAVVASVANRTHRPEPAIGALLYGPPPMDDAALVRLADALDEIERDVLR